MTNPRLVKIRKLAQRWRRSDIAIEAATGHYVLQEIDYFLGEEGLSEKEVVEELRITLPDNFSRYASEAIHDFWKRVV